MASLPVFLSFPPSSLLRVPPEGADASGFVPPPPAGSTPSAPPFDIPDHIYYAALDFRVPITIATIYAVTAKLLNAYNKANGKKPWAISKTFFFRVFVILHNVFLAVYSAWTWWGMFNTLRRTVVSPLGPTGVAGLVDSICGINGPAGLGNAAFFDPETKTWQSYAADASAVFGPDGRPSRFATGRLWNEGLAFYGWLFYLSKFYEVFDTLIILAKGKLSSTLQTYHHAGAMLCMWAGIRFMSVPIWIFVFFNSLIHAIMYTYYTATALHIRVPMFIKRSLTSMQITQFLVGGSLAMAHSFVHYTIPVIAGSKTDSASGAAASAAAGSESGRLIAVNLRDDGFQGEYTSQDMPCITNNGATVAVWLNVFYLAPLTYLFVAFFIESYLRRSNAAASAQAAARRTGGVDARRLSNVQLAEKAGWEAAKNIEREVYGENTEEAVVSEKSSKKANGKGRVLRNRY